MARPQIEAIINILQTIPLSSRTATYNAYMEQIRGWTQVPNAWKDVSEFQRFFSFMSTAHMKEENGRPLEYVPGKRDSNSRLGAPGTSGNPSIYLQ